MPQTQSTEPKRFQLQPFDDLHTVRGVEIFRAGEWNGEQYTTADLDEIISAFNEIGFQVPLKIGHSEGEGMPAFGWVDRVYRVGDVLKADFRDIAEWLHHDVFKRHAYDHVSCEIYFNLKRDGKTYKRVLKAVALLGAETPAVSGLAPLRQAIFAEDGTFEKVALHSLEVAMPEPVQSQKPTVSPEDFAALTAKFAEQQTALATLTASAKKSDETNTALLAQIATLTKQNADTAADAFAAKVKLPALAGHFRHLFGALDQAKVVKFKAEDGKETDKTLAQVLDEIVDQVNKFADALTSRKPGDLRVLPNNATLPAVSSYADASQELAAKIEEHLSKHPALKGAEGYQEATAAVLNADADLKRRYAEFRRGVAA